MLKKIVLALAEQRRIVAQVEALLAQADIIEREVEWARRRADGSGWIRLYFCGEKDHVINNIA